MFSFEKLKGALGYATRDPSSSSSFSSKPPLSVLPGSLYRLDIAASGTTPANMSTATPSSSSSSSTQTPIFLQAYASILPARDGMPFSHRLVISNAEYGAPPRDDDGEKGEVEVVTGEEASRWCDFVVSKAMFPSFEEASIEWTDKFGARYVFDADEASLDPPSEKVRQAISPMSLDDFRLMFLQALYETVNQCSALSIPRSELEGRLEEVLNPTIIAATPDKENETENLDVLIPGQLLKMQADFYKYDEDNQSFQMLAPKALVILAAKQSEEDPNQPQSKDPQEKSKKKPTSKQKPSSKRIFVLQAFNQDDVQLFEQEISNDMQAQFYKKQTSAVWAFVQDEDTVLCLSIKFLSLEDFSRFRNQFAVCLYEVNHVDHVFNELNEYDRSYITEANADDPMEVSDPESVEQQRQDDDDQDRWQDPTKGVANEGDAGTANTNLAVGYKTDRTFVTRGSHMGVFKPTEDGVEFKARLDLRDRKGNTFSPGQIMLHEEDSRMLMRDAASNRIMCMDLERGQVVEEWGGDNSDFTTPVKNIARAEKYSNLTANREFLGLNDRSLMRFDPRSREFVVESKQYAPSSRVGLEHMATTGAGCVAVASKTGDIRLYDTIGKNAKTHLPGLGDPIIGIDVTEDGNFVLATTKKYLLLIDTRVKNELKSGFYKSITKTKVPPKKLTILPQDIAANKMGELNFTPAHFNTGSSLEKSIVTSSGPFVITWNLRKVKNASAKPYVIRKYQDNVVADEYTYDHDSIIVTLPNDVTLNALRR